MEEPQHAPETPSNEEEPDWFGEASPFDSESRLAAALPFLLQPVPQPREPAVTAANGDDAASGTDEPEPDESDAAQEVPEPAPAVAPSGDGHYFEVLDTREERRVVPVKAPVFETAVATAPSWSVRIPGVEPLPLRQPGRTGWSIRNSVRILRRAEDLVMRLRQEAVVTAFNAAARALHGED